MDKGRRCRRDERGDAVSGKDMGRDDAEEGRGGISPPLSSTDAPPTRARGGLLGAGRSGASVYASEALVGVLGVFSRPWFRAVCSSSSAVACFLRLRILRRVGLGLRLSEGEASSLGLSIPSSLGRTEKGLPSVE